MIPYDAIARTAWQMLSNAADDPTQRLRLLVAATVTPEGKPSTRTVVLRGADENSGLLWFHSDRRSPKVRHLKQRPSISVLGYDPEQQVQIRLDGEATLHFDDALAQRHWQQVSMVMQHAYGQPHAPGEPVEQPDPRLQAMRRDDDRGKAERGRQNFMVIEMRVEVIDWLQIGADGQTRAILRASSRWQAEPLAP